MEAYYLVCHDQYSINTWSILVQKQEFNDNLQALFPWQLTTVLYEWQVK